MSEDRFALRTIRDGRVKIHGHTYRVRDSHTTYDGRLDGQRYLFGLYLGQTFVCLWGTEAAYLATRRNASPEMSTAYENGECDGAEVVNGTLPWMWWERE